MAIRTVVRRRLRLLATQLHPHTSAAAPRAESGVHNPLLPTSKRSQSAVSADGIRVAYDVIAPEGGPTRPETIVLLHGAGGSAAVWYQNAGHLARCGHAVIQWDSRCFGRSGGVVAEDFAVAALPEDLAAVLDAEGVDSAVLVCQSRWVAGPVRSSALHSSRLLSLSFPRSKS